MSDRLQAQRRDAHKKWKMSNPEMAKLSKARTTEKLLLRKKNVCVFRAKFLNVVQIWLILSCCRMRSMLGINRRKTERGWGNVEHVRRVKHLPMWRQSLMDLQMSHPPLLRLCPALTQTQPPLHQLQEGEGWRLQHLCWTVRRKSLAAKGKQ